MISFKKSTLSCKSICYQHLLVSIWISNSLMLRFTVPVNWEAALSATVTRDNLLILSSHSATKFWKMLIWYGADPSSAKKSKTLVVNWCHNLSLNSRVDKSVQAYEYVATKEGTRVRFKKNLLSFIEIFKGRKVMLKRCWCLLSFFIKVLGYIEINIHILCHFRI